MFAQNQTHLNPIYKPSEQNLNGFKRMFYFTVSVIICAAALWLPTDFGLPNITIIGVPLRIPMIIFGGISLLMWFTTLHFYNPINRFLVAIGMLLVWIVLVTIIKSSGDGFRTTLGIYLAIMNFTYTVSVYLILYNLFRDGFGKTFNWIISIVIVVSALVGIAEHLFDWLPPMYIGWYNNIYSVNIQRHMAWSNHRAIGTLGNPLVYATTLTLGIPFLWRIKPIPLRLLFIGIVFYAVIVSQARTALLFLVIMMTSIAMIHIRSTTSVIIAGLLLSVVYLIFIDTGTIENIIFRNNLRSLYIRYDLFVGTVDVIFSDNNYWNFFIGRGLGLASELPGQLFIKTAKTIENQYLTLLYEIGIIGMLIYIAVLGIPIFQYRKQKNSLHWYSLILVALVGFSFTNLFRPAINFIWIANMMYLAYPEDVPKQTD